MNPYSYVRPLLFAGLLALAACGSSEPDPQPAPAPPAPAAGSELKATVGSTPFAATGSNDIDGTRVSTSLPDESPARLVLRGRSGGNDVTLSIAKFTGAATYAVLPAGPSVASYTQGGSSGVSYNSQHMPGTAAVGEIVVTSWDPAAKRVKGTFTFSGRVRHPGGTFGATQVVTAGSFEVANVGLF